MKNVTFNFLFIYFLREKIRKRGKGKEKKTNIRRDAEER